MGKSIFNSIGGGQQPNFIQFMNQMRGQNPNAIIQQMVQAHGIDQSQMNAIQQRAQQISGQLEQFRGMFGF